jgi:hypothetical protein
MRWLGAKWSIDVNCVRPVGVVQSLSAIPPVGKSIGRLGGLRFGRSSGTRTRGDTHFFSAYPGRRRAQAAGTARDATERLFNDRRAVRKSPELPGRETLISTGRQPLDRRGLYSRVRSSPTGRNSRTFPE